MSDNIKQVNVHPLILEAYDRIKPTPNELSSLYESDCAVCQHALCQFYPDAKGLEFSVECTRTGRNLTHEMQKGSDNSIIFANIFKESHIRCTLCEPRESQQ